jgi:hypothetical protein
MTMRFRPANIRLINRRSNLPRLLLALSSINGKSNDKNNTTNVQGLTGHSISGRLSGLIQRVLHSPAARRCGRGSKHRLKHSRKAVR